jgi:hypothetical protein
VATGTPQMDDPRIRPFTREELKRARTFLALGQERSEAYTQLKFNVPL